jgi:serine/threonine-protein kinase RsbW/stage II sporulation protein AB (anti-sigma F factor)
MPVREPGSALDAVYPAQPTRVAEIRRDVANIAAIFGADETALLRITLAVSEAATNAILHAYRGDAVEGDVRVLVSHADEFLDVSIRDAGVGMSPRHDSPGLGLGLGLMAHEAYQCEIKSSPTGGTEIVLRFELAARLA